MGMMTHKSISSVCEALGLKVEQIPAHGRKTFSATFPETNKVRVYWSTSLEGGLLGLPRVITGGRDTHARSTKEIEYLVRTTS